jgi:prepilin-type N-terminal cleavage/methylation domain-containing protein
MTRRNSVERRPSGFTLVEMLIAMAITLVMIGAAVTLFANLSNSVRDRRAVVEMSGQLRHARNMLQQDLEGATCNGLVWQRPDENQGYIEIIEGPQTDSNPSPMLRDTDNDGIVDVSDFDVATSILPRNNAVEDLNGNGKIEDNEIEQYTRNPRSLAPGGLGDFDDILMLTVRNEHEPFVGRQPENVRTNAANAAAFDVNPSTTAWSAKTIESPLAEVVWYAIENPDADNNGNGFFGEPGMRTIYRRTLLIAPWVNPYRYTNSTTGDVDDTFQIDGDSGGPFTAKPGLVRILPTGINKDDAQLAIACLIAFQERYDLSVRLEFDPLLDPDPNPLEGGRWKIVANTLGDLTKRENRYEHHFYRPMASGPKPIGREFPFAAASAGSEYAGGNVRVLADPEVVGTSAFQAAQATLIDSGGVNDTVRNYTIEAANLTDPMRELPVRPFAYINDNSTTVATARAMLNDEGQVVRVVKGLVPLSGDRRGEDVMLTDALGFDLRVYDPGAFLYGVREDPNDPMSPYSVILEPTDPAWVHAYRNDMPDAASASASDRVDNFIGQGAYVDMGYGFLRSYPVPQSNSATVLPWFFRARALSDVYGNQLAPGFSVFDTWSFHYENDGLNEDHDEIEAGTWQLDNNNGTGTPQIDEGTNGLDDVGSYADGYLPSVTNPRLGPDDVGERETAPPYDKPLRGVQVLMRLYERDSRQIRQVSVNQSFVPE